MLNWTDEELETAGLDREEVESINRRLSRLGREMESMGLSVYGASGSGNLMHSSRNTHVGPQLMPDFDAPVARLDGIGVWDGGDW